MFRSQTCFPMQGWRYHVSHSLHATTNSCSLCRIKHLQSRSWPGYFCICLWRNIADAHVFTVDWTAMSACLTLCAATHADWPAAICPAFANACALPHVCAHASPVVSTVHPISHLKSTASSFASASFTCFLRQACNWGVLWKLISLVEVSAQLHLLLVLILGMWPSTALMGNHHLVIFLEPPLVNCQHDIQPRPIIWLITTDDAIVLLLY